MLLDWKSQLGNDIEVAYSSLEIDHQPHFGDGDVALLLLPNGRGIDVAWSDAQERFVVTLFQDEYDNEVQCVVCDDFREVVATVKQFYEQDRKNTQSRGETSSESPDHSNPKAFPSQ